MNIPTPAAVKKLTEDRKAREAELASSLAIAKDTMPPTKATRPSKGSSTPSAKHESGTDSAPSASFPKGKGSQDHPSSSKTRKGSRPSTSSTRRTTTDSTDSKRHLTSGSTSRTPRKNSSTKTSADGKNVSPEAKKPFVRPDHLTTKPLRNNEALLGLKKSLEKPARGQFKREYRIGGRRSGKTQAVQNKKENN